MFQKSNGSTVKKIYYLSDDKFVETHIPKAPPKSKIQGFDLPKKEQKWSRTNLPKDWYKDCDEEESKQENNPNYYNPELEAFRVQEWDRRDNGHWFMVNGNKTYITGEHYFYLNWWKTDFGYPDYRVPDLELYYFLQYCIEDPCCMGINEITLRRDGKTARAGSFLYQGISKNLNVLGGIISKTGSDAQKVFSKSVVLPWENLPNFFRPIYDYNSTHKKKIDFFAPGVKGKKALDKFKSNPDEEKDELQSTIDFKASNEFAYDGFKLYRFIQDEAGKLEEADVWERQEVLQPCFEKWGTVNAPYFGKMYCTTTVEDMTKVGGGFKKLTDNSDITDKDGNGRTKSGLYTYFKPAYKGYAYDEYGNALEKAGRTFFENKRKSLKNDPSSLSSHIRKHPFTISEAFMVDGDECVFNAMILNEAQILLNLRKVTQQGDFIWKDDVIDGKVIFVPNSVNGRFHISWLPEKDEDTNKVLEVRPQMINGAMVRCFKPDNDEKFAIATDPVDHAKTVDSRRSEAAAYVFRKYDYHVDHDKPVEDWVTNNFVVEYIYRELDPMLYYEGMIKICTFFGCQILVENQKNGIMQYFKTRGYDLFIMNRPKNTHTKTGDSQDTPGIPSSRPMIQQYTNKLMTFVQNHGHRIKFIRLVVDLLIFDPNKPTVHDPTVASGFTLIASEKPMPRQTQSTGGAQYFNEYNNSGTQSKLVD